MKQTILVTGATGFLGKHLISKLGFSLSIRCLVRKTPSTNRLKEKNIHYYQGDLKNKDSLREAFNGVETVIHMGAECSSKDPGTFYQTNVIGTQNMIELSKQCSIKKFIYLSSAVVLFNKEDSGTAYCKTKKEAEKIVIEAGLNSIILRPTSIYSSKDRMILPVRVSKYFPLIVLPQFLFERRFQQPVFVDDVIYAILTALKTEHLQYNFPYFIAGPNTETLEKFLDKNTVFPFRPLKFRLPNYLFKGLAALKLPIPFHISPQKTTYNFDLSHAKRDFGFNPTNLGDVIQNKTHPLANRHPNS